MILLKNEPIVSVGLIEDIGGISFDIEGEYRVDGRRLPAGTYEARADIELITLLNDKGRRILQLRELRLIPEPGQSCFITCKNIIIGRDFHWERFQSQKFHGEFIFKTSGQEKITVINRLPAETYLESVICSEMSPESPEEFLKAHSVISRSWLLAQIKGKKTETTPLRAEDKRWTDSAIHRNFDICADDHCQRYHGAGNVNNITKEAIGKTRGEVLVFEKEICDARFSKCCGGITENFSTAWQDIDVPYLRAVSDRPENDHSYFQPAYNEEEARRFIFSSPESYCNIKNKDLLAQILPGFDREVLRKPPLEQGASKQHVSKYNNLNSGMPPLKRAGEHHFETENFFRWQVSISKDELREIILNKTGIDFGEIKNIIPLARGASGRIYQLKITGEKEEKVFGKELEIRRILSRTHLYSSAFVAEPFNEGFKLTGAGWGHGVGLCQIGAASMAAQGIDYKKILYHYFRGAELRKIYM